MDEFPEMGFCILAGRICFCEPYLFIVVKSIDSNSESIANHCSKNRGGGQDNPARIG